MHVTLSVGVRATRRGRKVAHGEILSHDGTVKFRSAARAVSPLRLLLVAVPAALLAERLGGNTLLTFSIAAVGIVALSSLLGEAIEQLSGRTGPRIAALLNATLGNAAELIITFVALRAGHVALAQASIVGAILGNVLVVPGLGMLLGGLKHGRQHFDREETSVQSTMMSLAVVGLAIPTLFVLVGEAQRGEALHVEVSDPALDNLSLVVAALLIAVYVAGLVFAFLSTGRTAESPAEPPVPGDRGSWGLGRALTVLGASSLALIALSDVLVGSVEELVLSFGFSELFLGVVLIALVGDVAEHLVAVQQAYKDRMDVALAISLQSATQIALLVAPLLVFGSRLMGHEMTLFFGPFEVVTLGLAVFVATQVAGDGESNWLEGVQLLTVYGLAAAGFLFL